MDVFELALMRGTDIRGVKELMRDRTLIKEEHNQQRQVSGQKHTKKDYEKLKEMSMDDVMRMTRQEKKQTKFQDDELAGIVKVEKKKQFKKKPSKQADQDIQRLLQESPQDINYERAMKLYEEQPLEAKDISA